MIIILILAFAFAMVAGAVFAPVILAVFGVATSTKGVALLVSIAVLVGIAKKRRDR